ncbi:hypothetical protein CF392_14915, partial [Tamilnaduibacter salinus]
EVMIGSWHCNTLLDQRVLHLVIETAKFAEGVLYLCQFQYSLLQTFISSVHNAGITGRFAEHQRNKAVPLMHLLGL